MASGFIWDRKTGEQIAWIKDEIDVYSVATEQPFAKLLGGELYSLSGVLLNVHLESLHGDNVDLADTGSDADAVARFKKLASGS
jgi:hypothetical protein